jgi:hypothetical protein
VIAQISNAMIQTASTCQSGRQVIAVFQNGRRPISGAAGEVSAG